MADIDRIGRKTPLLVDLKPSGQNYMEDLHHAGGVPTLLQSLKPLLHLHAKTVTGRTLGEELARCAAPFAQNIVRPLSDPIFPDSSLVMLKGNLAPDGCVIKASAMSKALRKHEGKAVVFKGTEDMTKRIDRDDLEVDETSVCASLTSC